MLGWTYLKIIIKSSERGFDFFKASIEQIFDFAYVMVHYYSGISITPLQDGQYDEERIALLCGQTVLEKISINQTSL